MTSYLVSFKNACNSKKHKVIFSANSNFLAFLKILESEGFIRLVRVLESFGSTKTYRVEVTFGYYNNQSLIKNITWYNSYQFRHLSYHRLKSLVKDSSGLFIVSTSYLGICSHKVALKYNLGGFILAYIE